MTIARTRSILYLLARLLGDAQAVRRGRVGQRIANRLVGRAAAKLLRGLWR